MILFGFFVFTALIAIKNWQLKKAGVQTVSKKSGLKTYLTILLVVLFFALFTSELIIKSLKFSFILLPTTFNTYFHNSVLLACLGAFIEVLAVIGMYYTLSAFNTSLRFGLNTNDPGKLITTGIFNKSRNPFFLSIILQFTAITLVFPTPFFALTTLLSIIAIHFFILKEEKFMRENYGTEYKNYCSKVRRYF